MNSQKSKIGQLRPSQILYTYGIGAIADLLNFSVIIMGLDEWETTYTQEIKEDRLLNEVRKQLNHSVQKLLSPPLNQDTDNQSNFRDVQSLIGIPVAPFPSWMVCPACRLLAPLEAEFLQIRENPYRREQTYYVHTNCPKKKKPPMVIPVRFLVACEKGHLDDFPWLYFAHQGNSDCHGPLRLEEYGVSGSTTDIRVKCDGCNAKSRPLSDAFGELGKISLPQCRGRHPHLRNFDDQCDQQMKVMLLGASNSWFSVTLSALSLPLGSTELEEIVTKNWDKLQKATDAAKLELILDILDLPGLDSYSLEDIWKTISKKRDKPEVEEYQDLKTPEWLALSEANITKNTSEFQLKPQAPPTGFEKYFTQTVLVERLKEVRAFIGFTRIQSQGDMWESNQKSGENLAPISRQNPNWVPTSEVRGEGIFLQFSETELKNWENRQQVQKQGQLTKEAFKNWLNSRGIDPDKFNCPPMRYLLLHSFAHALMRQLAIACGYNAASLRERIYSQPPQAENGPQAGILIYTAASDSEGTLGGLVNLGQPDTLGYHVSAALEGMKLCASDPLCSENKPSNINISLHWAACHACLFSPETSCERGNKFLDRSLLVPTVFTSELAFFE
jgi:hypothetical protein